SEDIPSTRYCIFNTRDCLFLLFGLDKKPMGFRKRIGCSIRLILEKKIGERLQTLFPGDCGPGAFFWTERKVDIFQHRHRFCRRQLFSEFLGQKVTFPQALYDRFPSLIEFFELLETIANRSNLNFVKRAGGLFSVASNDRYRGTIREERPNRTNLVRLEFDLSSNLGNVNWVVGHGEEVADNKRRTGPSRQARIADLSRKILPLGRLEKKAQSSTDSHQSIHQHWTQLP